MCVCVGGGGGGACVRCVFSVGGRGAFSDFMAGHPPA